MATSRGSVRVTLDGSRRVLKPGDTLQLAMTILALDAVEVNRSTDPAYDLAIKTTDDKIVARWSTGQPAGSLDRLVLAKGENKAINFSWTAPPQDVVEMSYVVMGIVAGNSTLFPIVVNQRGE